jgi:hypothetical protein
MKKLFTLAAIVITGLSIAQKTNTTNAAMAYKAYEQVRFTDYEQAAKDLLEAKSYIDLSAEHAETKNDPKTLMYLGKIYIEIPFCAQTSGDATLKAFDAEECYKKVLMHLKDQKPPIQKKCTLMTSTTTAVFIVRCIQTLESQCMMKVNMKRQWEACWEQPCLVKQWA